MATKKKAAKKTVKKAAKATKEEKTDKKAVKKGVAEKKPAKKKRKTAAKKVDPIEKQWKKAMAAAAGEAKAYSMSEQFKIGDVIQHSTFGPGVVEKLMDTNKIQTVFEKDLKILIHNQA
jgi:hypothetical protein